LIELARIRIEQARAIKAADVAAELRRMAKECERRVAKANRAATGPALDEASLVLLAVPPEATFSSPPAIVMPRALAPEFTTCKPSLLTVAPLSTP
jgi:hypothetical protein